MNTEKHHVIAAAKAAEEIAEHCAEMFANAAAIAGYIDALECDLDRLKSARASLAGQAGDLLPQIVKRIDALAGVESTEDEIKALLASSINALNRASRAMLLISEGPAA